MTKILIIVVLCLITVAFLVFMWKFSKRRGFNPWCWTFSGLLGLIVLPLLPNPTKAENPEQAAQRTKRGNMIGLAITALTVVIKIAAKCLKHQANQ